MSVLDRFKQKLEEGKKGPEKPKMPEPKVEPAQESPAPADVKPEKVVKLFPGGEKKPEGGKAEHNGKDEPEQEDPRIAVIQFGMMIDRSARRDACSIHGEKGREAYIIGFGKKPQGVKGGLRVVGGKSSSSAELEDDGMYRLLQDMAGVLRRGQLPYAEGPYADNGDALKGLAKDVLRDVDKAMLGSDHYSVFDRIIDRLRPATAPELERAFPRDFGRSNLDFHLLTNLTTSSDELPTAGNILSDPERVLYNHVTGGKRFGLMHPMEPYVLACAVLRRIGMWAMPAKSIGPGGDADALIAVLDMKRHVPLDVFTLVRQLPDMGSMEVMTDKAVMGIVHGMRAFARIKHLSAQMVKDSIDGHPLSGEEVHNQLNRITDDLHTYCRMQGGPGEMIPDALSFLRTVAFQTETWIGFRALLPRLGIGSDERLPDPYLIQIGIEKMAPVVPINLDHMEHLLSPDGYQRAFFMHSYPALQPLAARAWMAAEDHSQTIAGFVDEKLAVRIAEDAERRLEKGD